MASMATDASRTGFRGPTEPPSWTVTSVLGVQVAVRGLGPRALRGLGVARPYEVTGVLEHRDPAVR